MPGFVVTLASPVMCAHGGQAKPLMVAPPRVFIMGVPVVTVSHKYMVAGCTAPAASLPACVTGQFTTFAARVLASAMPGMPFPLLVAPAIGFCVPPPGPLVAPPAGQTRVFAS